MGFILSSAVITFVWCRVRVFKTYWPGNCAIFLLSGFLGFTYATCISIDPVFDNLGRIGEKEEWDKRYKEIKELCN